VENPFPKTKFPQACGKKFSKKKIPTTLCAKKFFKKISHKIRVKNFPEGKCTRPTASIFHEEKCCFTASAYPLFRPGMVFGTMARLSGPSGKHKPMKEWVQVPSQHAHRWKTLAETAAVYSKTSG
jgi:hypothetical protein